MNLEYLIEKLEFCGFDEEEIETVLDVEETLINTYIHNDSLSKHSIEKILAHFLLTWR